MHKKLKSSRKRMANRTKRYTPTKTRALKRLELKRQIAELDAKNEIEANEKL